MYKKDLIYRDALQIVNDSKSIEPYVIVAQPRRSLKEVAAQNFEVWKFWNEIKEKYHYTELKITEDGLGILQFGNENFVDWSVLNENG